MSAPRRTYTPEQLEALATEHDRFSVCTHPARDHFAEVCREYAEILRSIEAASKALDALVDDVPPPRRLCDPWPGDPA